MAVYIQVEGVVRISFVGLCLVGLVGCGSEKSPVEKCDDLVEVVCDRGVECAPELGTKSSCVQAIKQALPCGMAERVSNSYDRCMDQLEDNSCSALYPRDSEGDISLNLPADCFAVIEGPDALGDVRISATFDPVSRAVIAR